LEEKGKKPVRFLSNVQHNGTRKNGLLVSGSFLITVKIAVNAI